MDAIINSLHTNHDRDLVPPSKDQKLVKCKWLFKCKCGEKGMVQRYKARLVAQGYSQRPGINSEKIFAPVVRFESIRSVTAIANHKNMKIHEKHIKNAFFNGELTEEVFVCQPEGFKQQGIDEFV